MNTYKPNLVQPVGIEPTSMVLQTTAMTTSAKVAFVWWVGVRVELTFRGLYILGSYQLKYPNPLGRRKRIELLISESQPEVLPLN